MRTQTTMVRTTIAKAGRKMARGMGSFPSAGGLSLSPSPLGRGVGVRVRRSRNGSNHRPFAVPPSGPMGYLQPEGDGKCRPRPGPHYCCRASLFSFICPSSFPVFLPFRLVLFPFIFLFFFFLFFFFF